MKSGEKLNYFNLNQNSMIESRFVEQNNERLQIMRSLMSESEKCEDKMCQKDIRNAYPSNKTFRKIFEVLVH